MQQQSSTRPSGNLERKTPLSSQITKRDLSPTCLAVGTKLAENQNRRDS